MLCRRLFTFLFLLTLPACALRPMDLVNPSNNAPTIVSSNARVAVWGGGSASTRPWHRRTLVSLTVKNDRPRPITLARKDLVLHMGFRRKGARSLVGSAASGRVEAITIPSQEKVELTAEFSTVLALRKKGSIALRFVEEGTQEVVWVDVPLRMRRASSP
ncbi:MAG: hypothetical protein A2Y95_02950 [Deltaproteobacteria bacterium RBG_13_65_10]|nr:MAG: hypothetical protein A2Y95_02950 [Deltaproteobacteria bacterium RBG_13_65_10]